MTEETIARQNIEEYVRQIEELNNQIDELDTQMLIYARKINDIKKLIRQDAIIFKNKYTNDVFKYIEANNKQVNYDMVVERFINVIPERATSLILDDLILTQNKVTYYIKDDLLYYCVNKNKM